MALQLEGLFYEVGGKSLLRDITLAIEDGSVACLYGPTGAGKTTLGLVVAGLLPASLTKTDLSGLPGRWSYLVGNKKSRKFEVNGAVAYLPPNPLDALVFPAVQDELESVTSSRQEMLDVLANVGLASEVLDEELSHLSGGMLQRLLVARTLLRKPRLVVADETYEWLDPEGQLALSTLLTSFANTRRAALVLHSTATQLRVAGNAFFLRDGRIDSTERWVPARWARARPAAPGAAILSVEAVSKRFGRGRPVLDGVSFVARRGEWIGVLGPNGAGKSVLCRLLAGLEREDSGSIVIDGRRPSQGLRSRDVGYVFQFPGHQLPLPRLGHILREVLPEDRHQWIYGALCGTLPTAGPKTNTLSMSPFQQRLAVLAVLIEKGVKVLAVDEPTWGCDADEVGALVRFLSENKDEERVTIIVSHNATLLSAVCDRTYCLASGLLVSAEGRCSG